MQAQAQSPQRTDFREMPILLAFFAWWLKEVPAKIIYIGHKSMRRTLEFFSVGLLLKSLFLPWKRDEIDTTNMALEDKLRVLMMNLISRLVGAVVRAGTVLVGLIIILGIFFATLIAVLGFILFPIIIVYLLYKTLIM